MFQFLYSLGNKSYYLLAGLAGFFSEKPKLFYNGRKGVFPKMEKAFSGNKNPVAWFHAASLGEFEQGRPVIEAFKKQFPDYKVLLTFFSPSGYEIRKNYKHADFIFYLPIDTLHNAKKFIEITKPEIAFFIKYEFWFHYINELKKKEIPIVSFSSIFRKEQLFFKKYGSFYKNILYNINKFFVQDENSEALLKSININSVDVAGDTRFDRVKDIVKSVKKIEIAEKFKNGQKLLVIGSSWDQDIDVIGYELNDFTAPIKIIVASHEIGEHHLSKIETVFSGKKTVRFSEANLDSVHDFDVLIIDNIGMLSSLYQYGEMAYIGGGFGVGIHNILEAATFGMPIIFGTNYKKFKEARELIAEGGAFSVANNEEFDQLFTELYQEDDERIQKGKISSDYVKKNTGATDLIIDYTKKKLSTV